MGQMLSGTPSCQAAVQALMGIWGPPLYSLCLSFSLAPSPSISLTHPTLCTDTSYPEQGLIDQPHYLI